MWSLEFVQVLDESKQKAKEAVKIEKTSEMTSSPKPIPVVQRASSTNEPSPPDDDSAAERLREFKDPSHLAAKQVELGSSAESDGGGMDSLKDHFSRVSQLQQGDVHSMGSNYSSDDLVGFI